MKHFLLAVGVGVWVASGAVMAQAPPRVIPFDGVVTDELGRAPTGVVSLTFVFYEQQTGGVPLWVEIQAVALGAEGGYTVLLGAMTPDGLPLELFATGAARWLGVQAEGQAEGPRVLLASAPYALKAADAETLGGLPVSAFALAGAPAGVVGGATNETFAVPGMQSESNTSDPGVIGNAILHGGGTVTAPICVGFFCATNEVFGDTLEMELKGTDPSIVFEDALAPAIVDWKIGKIFVFGNNQLRDAFSVQNLDSGAIPFRVEADTGHVGIGTGTTAPVSRVHVLSAVANTVHLQSTTPVAQMKFQNSDNQNGFISYGPGAFRFYAGSANVPKLTIAPDGNIGVGVNGPSHPLHFASGARVTSGGAFVPSSSRAKKDDIRALSVEDALAALRQLEPVQFVYKTEPNEPYVGFIAEDVPDLVATNDRKGLAPMDIVAVPTQVVQQQQARIDALEQRLGTLVP